MCPNKNFFTTRSRIRDRKVRRWTIVRYGAIVLVSAHACLDAASDASSLRTIGDGRSYTKAVIGIARRISGRGDKGGLTTRQYARLVQEWVASIGLDPAKFGTHSLRRTKAVLIYRRTGDLRAAQLLLWHSKIESTVRYLGIEVDDAIEIAEKIEI